MMDPKTGDDKIGEWEPEEDKWQVLNLTLVCDYLEQLLQNSTIWSQNEGIALPLRLVYRLASSQFHSTVRKIKKLTETGQSKNTDRQHLICHVSVDTFRALRTLLQC